MNKLGIFAVGLMVLTLIACSSDKESNTSSGSTGASGGYTNHSSPYPACDEIIKACHPLDIGEGKIHDCHDQGHLAKSDGDCLPVKDMCLDLCKSAAADAGVDAAFAH